MEKLDRNNIYSYALTLIENGNAKFCCDAIRMSILFFNTGKIYLWGMDLPALDLIDFPEFKAFEKDSFTWWPHSDKQSRINCLKSCIEKTK